MPSDGDFIIKGNDGGSTITALSLDMSAAGFATFNNGIRANRDISALGANTGSSANRMALSMEGSGVSRIICNGADGSTNGTFEVFTANSGGTGSVKLGIDAAGAATLPYGVHVGNLFIHSNRISSGYTDDSEDADVWINYQGYNGGATRFRDFRVGNGKQGQVLLVDGSSGDVSITDGNLVVAAGHGIDFGAAARNSGAAGQSNTLSDYETGTWTPTMPACTLSVSRANYTKVGRVVTLDFNCTITANDGSTAPMLVQGLPFTGTSSGGANSESIGSVMMRYINLDAGTNQVTMYSYSRVPTIEFYATNDNANWSGIRRNQITGASSAIIGTITITVDS